MLSRSAAVLNTMWVSPLADGMDCFGPPLLRLLLTPLLHTCVPLWVCALTPLQEQLQGLTYLCLGGLCLTDDVLGRVGDITRLRELELHNAPDVTPAGLEWLLNLRQLSRLVVHGAGCQRCLRFSLKAKVCRVDSGYGLCMPCCDATAWHDACAGGRDTAGCLLVHAAWP